MMLLGSPRAEPIDPSTCVELLTTAPLGRVAVSIGALPSVVPVPFLTDGQTILFPCVTEQLVEAVSDTVVAFQSDGCDDASVGVWSVLAQGRCRTTTRHPAAQAAFTAVWAGNEGAPVAELAVERLAGWLTSGVTLLGGHDKGGRSHPSDP